MYGTLSVMAINNVTAIFRVKVPKNTLPYAKGLWFRINSNAEKVLKESSTERFLGVS